MIRGSCGAAALLLLSGCGTLEAYHARTQLIGATEPDIVACMGPPDAKQYLSPGQHVLGWGYSQSGTDLDLELGIYALKLGRPGVCHASIRFERGYVRSVNFQDANVSPTNPDSICGRIVADCLHHRLATPLPPDFDSEAVLAGPTITVKDGVKR